MATGITFYGFSSRVGETVAAVICGLNCGTYTVAADGSVTVLYGSDPDGLFTQAYAIAMANSPPGQVATYGWGAQGVQVSLAGSTYTIPAAIGANYTSQIKLLRANADNKTENGPGLGKTRRLHMFSAYFVNTIGAYIGSDFTTMYEITPPGNGQAAYNHATMFTGVYWDTISSNYDFDGQLCVQVAKPYPCTVAAVTSFLHVMDR